MVANRIDTERDVDPVAGERVATPAEEHLQRRTTKRELVLACALFLALAVAFTWPRVLHLRTVVPATKHDADVATYVWNFWWVRHAVVELRTSPLLTDRIIAPFGADLRLHTLGLLDALVAIPFAGWLGPVGSLNASIVLTMALNGLCAFLLARRVLGSGSAALLAGVLVEVSPTSGFHLTVGRPFLGSVWVIALALLFLLRLADGKQWRDAIGFGAALLAALLMDFQVVLFASLWVGVLAVWLLATRHSDLLGRRFLTRAGAGSLVALVPFASIWLEALLTARTKGFPVPSVADTLPYSMSITDVLTPEIAHATFGLIPPLLALVAIGLAFRDRTARVWLVGGLFFSILVLGAYLRPTGIPLPFLGLHWLPGLDQFRTPYRFAVPASLGISIAGAQVLGVLVARLQPAWLRLAALALAVLCLFADARIQSWPPKPFPGQRYPTPAVYEAIAADPHDGLVLEVPVGFRSGIERFGPEFADILVYHQIVHGKRLINGMVARLPSSIFAFYRGSPALRVLAGEALPVDQGARADFDAKTAALDVRWIVVHRDMIDAATAARVEALIGGHPGFKPMEATATIAAWRRAD
ncbi:MAG: hypothetical protein LAO05_18170 [Acidobacteriia bacterium]|nr:hypothetical protein [Terriglobia bacterium]